MHFILPNIIFSQYMLPDAYQKLAQYKFNNQKIHLDSAQFSSVIEIIQRMEQNPNYSTYSYLRTAHHSFKL